MAAIVVEPLQGEGGFIPAPIEWVKAVRKICDEHGILLVADEVQTGFCRTGKMFASEYWAEAGAAPDIMTSAKSIAAGLPLSAITAREEIMDAVLPGTIGGTFSGNPLACAAVSETLSLFEKKDILPHVEQMGVYLGKCLDDLVQKKEIAVESRGMGLMRGLELTEPAGPYVTKALEKGVIFMSAGTHVIRFVPPLVIEKEDIDQMIAVLDEIL